jgi:hypothetical protein
MQFGRKGMLMIAAIDVSDQTTCKAFYVLLHMQTTAYLFSLLD